MKKVLLLFIVLFFSSAHFAMAQWPAISQAAKPWTRWWWMGSAVDKVNISAQLAAFSRSGMGGVEIVPIYGAVGHESAYIKYLDPQWMAMLDHTVQQSNALNMGVYISVGTGWPIGGPQVSTEDAATKLIVQTFTLNAGQEFKERILVSDMKQKDVARLIALTAYSEDGKAIVITDKVSPYGTLEWRPATGKWTLYAAFAGKTKQLVKRAAPGGEGYTLDHFSSSALKNYFKTFDTAFGGSAHGVKAFYNDSYEVYNADWTPDFFTAFQQLRGYDLRLFLREMVSKDSSDKIARIKSDYRETISDLMLKNFAQPFTKWSHSKKALSLNQAHGSPGNLLDLYAAFDIPEAETFGSSAFDIPGLRRDSADIRNVDPDPIMLKFASSAAHAMGNKLVSCETFTWLTEHFKTSWSQCKPEVEQAFLAGINHVFYHGTTYSPSEIKWPGWLFYASVNFVPANSLWPHLKGLNNYIARCQAVLQEGQPDNELLAYWPVYDAWNDPKGMDMPFKVHDISEFLHPTPFYKNVQSLQANGYSIDFASDKMLKEAQVKNGSVKVSSKGASHKVLLVSRCNYMPAATLQQIIRLAKEGAAVVIQQLPGDVPGFTNTDSNRSAMQALLTALHFTNRSAGVEEALLGKGKIVRAENIPDALEYLHMKGESLTKAGLKFIRRSTPTGRYYFIVNHTAKNVDRFISLNTSANSVLLSDPLTGRSGKAMFKKEGATTAVRLQLQPGESILIKLGQQSSSFAAWKYIANEQVPVLLSKWRLHFKTGGPFIPADRVMDQPQPWTNYTRDSATQSFSGTGSYTLLIDLPLKASEYILKLDKLYQSARVIINGKDAGIMWSIPYELRIGKYLIPGKNTIEIEVCNLMANRIRYMDINKMQWRKYHEINFVNINYKNFDAASWKVEPSGLEGVTIVRVDEIIIWLTAK